MPATAHRRGVQSRQVRAMPITPTIAPTSRRVSNKVERYDLVQQGCRHVEAAAVHVEIDERQGALVGKARAVQFQEQLRVFRVRVGRPSRVP